MADGARVKQDQVSDPGGKGIRVVWVNSGGRQPPQLKKSSVTSTGVRTFLSAYNQYKKGIEYSNEDGVERRVASLRGVVDPYIK